MVSYIFPSLPQGNFAYLSSVDYAIMYGEVAGGSMNDFIRGRQLCRSRPCPAHEKTVASLRS
jgi:hypothetical protein